MYSMKFFTTFLISILVSAYGMAQEIPGANAQIDFIIKRTEIVPSLSILAPENPYVGKFRIRTVNFDEKEIPIEVNISEVMREVEYERANRYVELAPPVQLFTEKKNSVSFSMNPRDNDARYFNQNFNPYLPRTGTRNTVYKDASEITTPIYYSRYSPFYRRY